LVVRLPPWAKGLVSDIIAVGVYLPLAKISRLLEFMGFNVSGVPLSAYRSLSWYTMRTDSVDRFGTPLEQRFTRAQIAKMMCDAGFESITVGDSEPYWCAVGFRRADETA
jgi:hypothetical protein